MTRSVDNAVAYLSQFVSNLLPNAELQVLPERGLVVPVVVRINDESYEARFGLEELDDFEVALEKYRNTNYFHTLENRIRFRLYLILGSAGLLRDFEISGAILEEKGEWLKNYTTDIAFDNTFCQVLYEGLKLLSGSLGATLSSTDLPLDDVREDKDDVDNLVRYYEKEGHLTSQEASLKSLSFLKAAAVCVILDREKQKRESAIPRVQKGLDREIYSIVAKIREAHFRDIKLPECVYEYAIQLTNTPEDKKTVETIKHAIDQNPASSKLVMLLEQLDPKLRRRWEGAWQAFRSDNPDRLSQASNSMVELLDQVIRQVCENTELDQFLTDKYQTHEDTGWVVTTRAWIRETKNQLQRVKHHTDSQSEILTERLLAQAESVMLVVLE